MSSPVYIYRITTPLLRITQLSVDRKELRGISRRDIEKICGTRETVIQYRHRAVGPVHARYDVRKLRTA